MREKNEQGRVFDPHTGEELFWDKTRSREGQWDMGHKRGRSYDDLKKAYIDGEVTHKEFLNEYNNDLNYHPQAAPSNRSRKHD